MARRTSVVSSPLKLPKAPDEYSERDQDHTRRLIELALIAYTQQLAGVIKDVATQNVFGKDFPPVSPIHGQVSSLGDVGGTPAYARLLNPSDSGKLVVIYELWCSQEGNANQQIRIRTTDVPATLGGVTTTAVLAHRNELDVTAITSTLQGCTIVAPNPPFATTDASFWENALSWNQPSALPPNRIIWPGHHPIILLPGQALEVTEPLTGAAVRISMYVCFDELPLAATIGTDLPLDTTAPISSCWSSIRQAGSVNDGGFIQFFNPGPTYAKVTGLYVITDAVNVTSVRRTAEPINVVGAVATVSISVSKRMNRGSIEPIYALLKSTNLTSNANDFATVTDQGASFWRDKGRAQTQGLPYTAIVGPYSFPIIVKPNSAIEISVAGAGVGLTTGVLVMWDEVETI
ncbi:MAG TPA: hypothetical protein VEZ51_09655 [Gemmatimonadaceae bacterium]|nr:hypothetical protein [Gemmatimonadaceae bacterium]